MDAAAPFSVSSSLLEAVYDAAATSNSSLSCNKWEERESRKPKGEDDESLVVLGAANGLSSSQRVSGCGGGVSVHI